MNNIKFIVFDYDGVFTDGNIIFDNDGNIIKKYNVKDGYGIKLLKNKNIKIGVISGYKQNISQKSILEHLNIDFIELGCNNKLEILNKWCKILNIDIKKNVCYMGDDLNDMNVINNVYFSSCPQDAHNELLNIVDFVSKKKGGNGCIRELCDYIINNNYDDNDDNLNIIKNIKNEFNYQIDNFNLNEIEILSKIILNTKGNIYFTGVGKSENISKHCCDLLKSISIKSFYLNILNCNHGDIGTMDDNDIILMFSNSGNTIELINCIDIFKRKNIKVIGICCNNNSNFKELCDIVIVTPHKNEITGTINKIPTNSYMSHLLFTNILVSILKKNITLDKYKENHQSGNIGKKLLKVKDILINDFPKIVFENEILLHEILLKMTQYKIGCCFFVNNKNELIGLLTDGDIRRILIKDNNKKIIKKEDFNRNYYYITDINLFIYELKEKYNCIPILDNNKYLNNIVKL